MTHQNNPSSNTIEDQTRNGLEVVPELIRVIITSVMQPERTKYLQAEEYERTEERKRHANGYKLITVKARIGEITFAVPQVREEGSYPLTLEKVIRSERALVIALAEFTQIDLSKTNKPSFDIEPGEDQYISLVPDIDMRTCALQVILIPLFDTT